MVKTPATGKRKAAPAPAEDDAAAVAVVDAIGNVSKITPVPDEFSPPMAKRLRSAKKPRKPRRSESAERTTVLPVAAVGDENGENGGSMANNNDNDNDNNNSDSDNVTTKNDQMQQDDRADEDDDHADEGDDQEEGEEEVEDEPMPAAGNDDDQQPATEDPLTAEDIANEIMEEIVADDITNEIMEEMAADDVTNHSMDEVAAATVDPREPEAKVAANTEHEPLEPPFDTTAAAAAAAASTVDATTTAIATNGKHISPIAKLRMPSQHTPGKVSVGQNYELTPTIMLHHQRLRNLSQEDHASKTPDAPPVVNRVTTERPHLQVVHDEIDEIMVVPPTDDTSTARQRWWQTTLGQFQEILTTMVLKAPPSEQQQQQPDNHDGVEVEHATPSAKPWTWSMWFLTFFTLQLVILTFSMQHLYPSMDALVVSTIRQYKVEAPEIVENVTYEQLPNEVVTVTRTKPPPPLDPELDLGSTLDTLVHQLAAVDGSFADLTTLQSTLMGRLQSIRPSIVQHQASLHAWEMSLEDAEHELDQLLSHAREDIPQLVHRASVALAAMTAPYTATVPLISITSVPMWTVPPPVKIECPTRLVVPATGEDALVTVEQMEHAERTLATMVTESVEAVKHNIRGTAQTWIQQYIGSIAKQHVVEDDTVVVPAVELPEVLQTGLSEADVMSTIMDTLELDLADKTGVIDYASLYAGAKIIRHGPRATSPSLVDTLPLFNKLLRATKLRFYGYGPEAALTPTKPWNALGQCWSFSDMTKNKKRKWKNAHRTDNTNGKYATLSIQLAQPIRIGSIVLEHTLPTTGQHHQDDDALSSRSAPKDVRVFGYMDPEASGRPFPLGEFTFDTTAQSLQTFVITEMNNVKLQSVTLALDSNHGNDYTCLYRFRVHAAKQK